MASDEKKRINLVDIELLTHGWIVTEANKAGMSIRGYAGYLLDDARAHWEPPKEGEPGRLAVWNYHQALAEEHLQDLAYRTAVLYEKNRTEEMADLLARQCEYAGLDYSEVIQQVADDPYSSLVAFSHNGTKLGDCIRWLSDILRDKKDGMAANILFLIGDNGHGFGETLINRAKRAMKRDLKTPDVKSDRRANGWYWVLEDNKPMPAPEPRREIEVDGPDW